VQVVIALIVTPEGFPLTYEVLLGKLQRQHLAPRPPGHNVGSKYGH
jgi:hypothetical protein